MTDKKSSINKKKKTKKIETDSESSKNVNVVLNSSSSDLEWFEEDTNDHDDKMPILTENLGHYHESLQKKPTSWYYLRLKN